MEVVEAALACRRSVGLTPLHHLRVRDQGSLWKARCVFIERRVGSMTMCAVESAGLRIVTARYRSVRCLFVIPVCTSQMFSCTLALPKYF